MASASTNSSDPISEFFANYPDFDYDPTKPPGSEFNRMCRALNIPPKSDERNEARNEFNNAIARKFNRDFGTDVNSLPSWQALCVRVQMDPVPDTLAECKKEVQALHINLVDLVDETEITVRRFNNVSELKNYSVKKNKIFPKDNAYAGDLLRYLLREFFTRYRGRRGRENERSRGKKRGRQ